MEKTIDEIVKEASECHSSLEDRYIMFKVLEDTGQLNKAIAPINYKGYEYHIYSGTNIRGIYNRKTRKLICKYEIVQEEEKDGDSAILKFRIKEHDN